MTRTNETDFSPLLCFRDPCYNGSVSLTGKQKRFLRGLAHALNPVVVMGHRGISESLTRQVDTCLTTHELIKIKLGAECPVDRAEAAAELAARTQSDVAGEIGRVIILYRRRADNPTILLPDGHRGEVPE